VRVARLLATAYLLVAFVNCEFAAVALCCGLLLSSNQLWCDTQHLCNAAIDQGTSRRIHNDTLHRTRYIAALEPVSDSEVHGHAWQQPGIRLHTVYALQDTATPHTATGTHVTERVAVEAPFFLRWFVIGQASKAHLETLRKIKKLLEVAESS
jgi:hypothetical protein